jgi:hypothetical protein
MEQGHGLRHQQVKLGQHEYVVVAQRHAYLQRKLGPQVSEALNLSGSDAQAIIKSSTVGYHGLLNVFIPDLMPLWEWEGYASETAMESDQYDEQADKSPTIDEMVTAFQAVATVNRLDLLGKLKDLIGGLAGPDFFSGSLGKALRARMEVEGIKLLTNVETTGESASESSPAPSGEPPQRNGGTSLQTSESSGAGPTPASSPT